MKLWTSVRTGRSRAAASGQKPAHTSTVPTMPQGDGHRNVTERKHACRQSTTPAVTRVKAENTGSSRASPELSVCRANATQPKRCCWYRGSPSCSALQPLGGAEGSGGNVKTKSPSWLSPASHTERPPNTKHRLCFLFPSPAKVQRPATSDKMEAALTAWQEAQGGAWVQSAAASSRASFRWFNKPPSQNAEFLTAGSAAPTITYHEASRHPARGPSRTQPVPEASVQCVCTQAAWQPLLRRSLQLRVCNSLRSLKEPVCFFCPRGRPDEALQQAGLTVFRETHRLRGRKVTYTQRHTIIFNSQLFESFYCFEPPRKVA
ncbi:hypothetical protein EYF80_002165 [Liparis tanakae]|uniref:Uncharacterized protein n=1 Tax=Liparis tanakae TaxID=230148 RepID=A0A4Z2JCV1_9TELE|nr:hypothetical protein EYF80_002165 [Liparis tanakae]